MAKAGTFEHCSLEHKLTPELKKIIDNRFEGQKTSEKSKRAILKQMLDNAKADLAAVREAIIKSILASQAPKAEVVTPKPPVEVPAAQKQAPAAKSTPLDDEAAEMLGYMSKEDEERLTVDLDNLMSSSGLNVIAGPPDYKLAVTAIKSYLNKGITEELDPDLVAKIRRMFNVSEEVTKLEGELQELGAETDRAVMDIDRNEKEIENLGKSTVLKIARLLDQDQGPRIVARYARNIVAERVKENVRYEKEFARIVGEKFSDQASRMIALSQRIEAEHAKSDPLYSLDSFMAWKKSTEGSADEKFMRHVASGMTYGQFRKAFIDLGSAVPVLTFHQNVHNGESQFLPSAPREAMVQDLRQLAEEGTTVNKWIANRLLPSDAALNAGKAIEAHEKIKQQWLSLMHGGKRPPIFKNGKTMIKGKEVKIETYYHDLQRKLAESKNLNDVAYFLQRLTGVPVTAWRDTIKAGARLQSSGADASLNNLFSSLDYALRSNWGSEAVAKNDLKQGTTPQMFLENLVSRVRGIVTQGVGPGAKPAVRAPLNKMANAISPERAMENFTFQYAHDVEGARQINAVGYGPAVTAYLAAKEQDPAFKDSSLAMFLGSFVDGKPVSAKHMNSVEERDKVLRDFYMANPGRMWALLQTGDRKKMIVVNMARPSYTLSGNALHPELAALLKSQMETEDFKKLKGQDRLNALYEIDKALATSLLQKATIGGLAEAWNGDAIAMTKRSSNLSTNFKTASLVDKGIPAAVRFAVVQDANTLMDGASFISVEHAKEFLRSFNMMPAELERLARDWDKYSVDTRVRQIENYLSPRFGVSSPDAAIAVIMENNPSIKMAMMKAGMINPVAGKANAYVMTPEYKKALGPNNTLLKAWNQVEEFNKTVQPHEQIRVLIGSNSMKDVSHAKKGSVTQVNPAGFTVGTYDSITGENTDWVPYTAFGTQAALAKDGSQASIDAAFQSLTDAQLKGNTGLNRFEYEAVMAQLSLARRQFTESPDAWRKVVEGSDNLALKTLVAAGVDRANPIVAEQLSRILEASVSSARRMKFRGTNAVNAPVGDAPHVLKGYSTPEGYVYGTAIAHVKNAPAYLYRQNFASKEEATKWIVDTILEGHRFDMLKWGLLSDKYENPDAAFERWSNMDRAEATKEVLKMLRAHEIIQRPSMEKPGESLWSVPGMLLFANRTPGTSLSSHPALRLGEDPGAGFGNNMMTHQKTIDVAGIDYDGDKMGLYGMWIPKTSKEGKARSMYRGVKADGSPVLEDAEKQARYEAMAKSNLYLLARQELYDGLTDDIREATTSGSAFYEKGAMYAKLLEENHAALTKKIMLAGRKDLLSADGQSILVQKVLDSKDSLGAAVSNLGMIYLQFFNNGMGLSPVRFAVPTEKGDYNYDPQPLVWGPDVKPEEADRNFRRAVNLQRAFNKLVNAIVDDTKYVAMADLGFNIDTVAAFEYMLLGAPESEILDLQNPANDEAKVDALYEKARQVITSPIFKRISAAKRFAQSTATSVKAFLGPREMEELVTGKLAHVEGKSYTYKTFSKFYEAYKANPKNDTTPVGKYGDAALSLAQHLDRVSMWSRLQGNSLKLGMGMTGGISAMMKSEASIARQEKSRSGNPNMMSKYIYPLSDDASLFERISQQLTNLLGTTVFDSNSLAQAFRVPEVVERLKDIGVSPDLLANGPLVDKLKAMDQVYQTKVSGQELPYVEKPHFSPDDINAIASRYGSLIMARAIRRMPGVNEAIRVAPLSELGKDLQGILAQVPKLGALLEARRWRMVPNVEEDVQGVPGLTAQDRAFMRDAGVADADLDYDFIVRVKDWIRRNEENDTPKVLDQWADAFNSIPDKMVVNGLEWTKKDVLAALTLAGIKTFGATTAKRAAGNYLSLMPIEAMKMFDEAFADYRDAANGFAEPLSDLEELFIGGWSPTMLIPGKAIQRNDVAQAMNVPADVVAKAVEVPAATSVEKKEPSKLQGEEVPAARRETPEEEGGYEEGNEPPLTDEGAPAEEDMGQIEEAPAASSDPAFEAFKQKWGRLATSDRGMPIRYVSGMTHGRLGHPLGARMITDEDTGEKVIQLDLAELYKSFQNKQWATPRVPGVIPLPADFFKTVDDWIAHVLEHEYQHTQVNLNPMNAKLTDAEYAANEMVVDDAALKARGLPLRSSFAPGAKAQETKAPVTEAPVPVSQVAPVPAAEPVISNPGTVTLTPEQQVARTNTLAFLRSLPGYVGSDAQGKSKSNTAVVSGYAGTGKTFTIGHIMNEVRNKFNGDGILYSAPTHAAAKIITENIKRQDFPAAVTLAKALGMRPDATLDDFDPIDPKFSVNAKKIMMPKQGVMIVDEASMVNKDLLALLQQLAKQRRTGIIFMGDHGQLGPVGEGADISRAIIQEGHDAFSQLTQVMRTASSNPLMDIFTAIRNNIEAPFGSQYDIATNWKGNEGIVATREPAVFQKHLRELLYSAMELPAEERGRYVRLITGNKFRVDAANDMARALLGFKTKGRLAVGEIMVGYKNIGGEQGEPPILRNSFYYQIADLGPTHVDPNGIEINHVVLNNLSEPEAFASEIDIPTEKGIKKYLELRQPFLDRLEASPQYARQPLWEELSKFDNQYPLMKDAGAKEKGNQFSNFAGQSIDYGYSTTVHKVQGSGITNPVILLDGIEHFQLKNRVVTTVEKNRMAYTAFTRAIKGVLVFSSRAKVMDQPTVSFYKPTMSASALAPAVAPASQASRFQDTRDTVKEAYGKLSRDNESVGTLGRDPDIVPDSELSASVLKNIVGHEEDPLSFRPAGINSKFQRMFAAVNALNLETNLFHNNISQRLGLWKRDYIEPLKARTITEADGTVTKDSLFDTSRKAQIAWTKADRQTMGYYADIISTLSEDPVIAAAIKARTPIASLARIIDAQIKAGISVPYGHNGVEKDYSGRDITSEMPVKDLWKMVMESEAVRKLQASGREGDFNAIGLAQYAADLARKKQAIYERFQDVMGYIENYVPRYYGDGGVESQRVQDARDRVDRILKNKSVAIKPSDTLLTQNEFAYPAEGEDFGAVTEPQKTLIRQYDQVYRKTVVDIPAGRTVPWHTEEDYFKGMNIAQANGIIARALTEKMHEESLAQGEAFKADPKMVATIQKIRAVSKHYGKKADSSRAHSRVLNAKTYSEAFKKYGLKPDNLNAFDLHRRYVRDVANSLTERVLLQDMAMRRSYNGQPLLLVVPSEKAKGRGAIPADVLMAQARMIGDYLGKPVGNLNAENVGKVLRDLITGSDKFRSYVTVPSAFDGIAEFRALPGDAEAVIKHLSLEPVKWIHGDVDYAEQLTRAVQWTKMLSVGWSIFFPLSLGESVIAGTGLKKNILWELLNPAKAGKTLKDMWRVYTDMSSPGTAWAGLVQDMTSFGVDFGSGASTDEAYGVVAKDIERIVESVRLEKGEKAAKIAENTLKWMTGQKFSGMFFEKLFPAVKLWAAHRLATETAAQLGLDFHDPFDRAHVMSLVAPTINNAYGGQFWKRYAWANPRVMQRLNWLMFAPNWTISNANLGGMGVLTGQALGNTATSAENRFIFMKNWPAMALLVMLGIPTALQAAIYAMAKVLPGQPPDDDDTAFMPFNEEGRESYIDITPLLRKSPFYEGDPTGKRRNYMRFGKQGYEIVSGWLTEPIDQFMRKLSQPARLVWEEATGRSPGSDWNLEFQGQGWAGWLKTDKDGVDSFLTSRAGYAAQKFLPMSLVTWLKDPSLGILPAIAPLSKGKSLGMATKDFTTILQAYADDESYNFLLQNPVAKERLAALAPGILQAAEKNGYNTDKIVNTAKGTVLSHIYKKMWEAADKGDTEGMDRYAKQALRVGGTIEGAARSMKNQVKNFGRQYTPEMQDAINEAFKGTKGKDPLEGKVD